MIYLKYGADINSRSVYGKTVVDTVADIEMPWLRTALLESLREYLDRFLEEGSCFSFFLCTLLGYRLPCRRARDSE